MRAISSRRAVVMCAIIGRMKKKSLEKDKAVALRKKGLSYGEILKYLNVSKSTLSLWLKSVPLEPKHRERLYTKQVQILSRGPQSQRERRKREIDAIIDLAKKEIDVPISDQALKLFGAALYWGEGSKGNRFQVTNSDPRLILFMVGWVENVLSVKRSSLKARLNIYPQQNDDEIKRFWSDLTGIPLKNFGKSYVKPISKGFKKNNLYYGTMRIEAPKSSNSVHQVYGWIQAVLEREKKFIEEVERRWARLTKVERPANLDID